MSRKRAEMVSVAIVLLAACASGIAWAVSPTEAVILRVLDGDTLEGRLESGTVERLRLEGIDCPELGQPGGAEARRAAARMVEGGRVILRARQRDRYGRLIAEVYTRDGDSVNEQLVSEGWCWWYRKHAPDNRRLERVEAEARAARRGLWAEPEPVPPWQWRKRGGDK